MSEPLSERADAGPPAGGSGGGDERDRVPAPSRPGAPDAGSPTPAERQLAERADPRTNTLVQVVLRVGLGAALVLLLAGLIVQLATGHHEANPVKMFDLWAPRSIGERVMAVGVLVLAMTPAAGVVSVVSSWIVERDRRFVGVGLIVVLVLSAAVVVGLG